MDRSMPIYDLSEFIKCCDESKHNVFIHQKATDDANLHFGLKTKNNLLDFISNGGLEEINFINSQGWENNPDKTT